MTTLAPLLVVFAGAGIGGVLRHVFNGWVTRLAGADFPLGILLINVVGSFAMGLVVGWLALRGEGDQSLRLFLATGVLGGFTTFSSFSLDAVALYERGQAGLALLYVLASVIASIAALAVALWVVRSME